MTVFWFCILYLCRENMFRKEKVPPHPFHLIPQLKTNPIKLHIIITYMMTDHNNDVTMVMMMIMVMTKTTQQNNIFIISQIFPNRKNKNVQNNKMNE